MDVRGKKGDKPSQTQGESIQVFTRAQTKAMEECGEPQEMPMLETKSEHSARGGESGVRMD